jgi:hypothetical protein
MLKIGTRVKIISKSVGVSFDGIRYKEGYVVKVLHDGIKAWDYFQDLYYYVWPDMDNGGDHYLEYDLINLDDFFIDEDFEI